MVTGVSLGLVEPCSPWTAKLPCFQKTKGWDVAVDLLQQLAVEAACTGLHAYRAPSWMLCWKRMAGSWAESLEYPCNSLQGVGCRCILRSSSGSQWMSSPSCRERVCKAARVCTSSYPCHSRKADASNSQTISSHLLYMVLILDWSHFMQ